MDKEEPAAAPQPLPKSRVMRLFDITQIAAARVVDVRNVLPLLQFAHLTRAHLLQDICMQVPALPLFLLYISVIAVLLFYYYL